MTLPVAAKPEVDVRQVDSFLGGRDHFQEILIVRANVIWVAEKAPACGQRITKIKNRRQSTDGSHVN